MAYEKVKALVGKRIKIVRGTPTGHRTPGAPAYYDVSMWCAGDVPVGSTGTIVDLPGSTCLCQIEWDHGQKPKPGYAFGISAIRPEHGFEEIHDEKPDVQVPEVSQ